MKEKMLVFSLAAIGFAASAVIAQADVTINSDGTGFVGKGDVQSVFDWNNTQLQENANTVKFRVGAPRIATWRCLNPAGKVTGNSDRQQLVSSELAIDERKNKQGQITGFTLKGFAGTTTAGVGECPTNWILQEGSLLGIEGDIDELDTLQVSIDNTSWFDLN